MEEVEDDDDDADAGCCLGGWPERLRDEVADLEAIVRPNYMAVFQEGLDVLKRGSLWNGFGNFIRGGNSIIASVGRVRDPLEGATEGKELKVGIFWFVFLFITSSSRHG